MFNIFNLWPDPGSPTWTNLPAQQSIIGLNFSSISFLAPTIASRFPSQDSFGVFPRGASIKWILFWVHISIIFSEDTGLAVVESIITESIFNNSTAFLLIRMSSTWSLEDRHKCKTSISRQRSSIFVSSFAPL